jgi:hypothetical protein
MLTCMADWGIMYLCLSGRHDNVGQG